MKFSMVQPHNFYFTDTYVPADATRWIKYFSGVTLQAEVRYILSFWVLTKGDVSNVTYQMEGEQMTDAAHRSFQHYTGPSLGGGSSWTKVDQEIRIPSVIQDNPTRLKETGGFRFWLTFQGSGTVYLDDISLKKAE